MKTPRTIGIALALLAILGGPAAEAQGARAHVDRHFGSHGIVRLSNASEVEGSGPSIALSGDGRIFVASRDSLSALLAGGRPDLGFGNGGITRFGLANGRTAYVEAIAVDPEGRPVVVGGSGAGSEASPARAYVARFTPEGAPDPSFGEAGYVGGSLGLPTPSSGALADRQLQQVAFDGTGRIVAEGFEYEESEAEPKDFFVRLDETGAPDPSFATNGVRPVPEIPDLYDETRLEQSWDVGPGGTLSIAIERTAEQSLLRLEENGSPDGGFGQDGIAPYPDETRSGPLVDPQGRTITWGYLRGVEHRLPNGVLIQRLTPAGEPDLSFGERGSVEVRVPHLYTDRLQLDDQGRILIAASLKGRGRAAQPRELGLIRLREDGRIDKSFARGGTVHIPFPKTRYSLLTLEELDVRGDRAALLATDCGRDCEPVVALVDLG